MTDKMTNTLNNTEWVMISVIVPVYNVEKYLRKCIDSIIGQTYQNLEIILVDDGSPDNCGAICNEYAQKDRRIRVIHKENGGLSSARNAALDIATGNYVMFVDSDDWVELDFCKKALEMTYEHHVKIVSFGYRNILGNGRIQNRVTNNARLVDSSEAIRHLILWDDAIYNFAWNKIYDRCLFQGIRFPLGRTYEDNAVVYKLIERAKKIYVSDEILYNYLIRPNSISYNWFHPKSIIDRFAIYQERLESIKKMCPENKRIQLLQVASEAVDGIVYLEKNAKYRNDLAKMHQFLSDNKQEIKKSRVPLKIAMYYYARPLLPMIKLVRIIKQMVGNVKWTVK